MNKPSTSQLENFLSDGMQVLAIAKQAQAKLDRHAATGFSVFDYFRDYENDLSRVFAGLLDPKGGHGQGAVFLQLFLEEINLIDADLPADENWNIDLEHSTDKGRRIDIVLNRNNRWLGIENKPWAKEQENQVQDYWEYLTTKDAGACICYFSGYGGEPESMKDKENCLTVPYRMAGKKPSVEGWISQCLQACESEPVRWFLKDLLKYIRYKFYMTGAPRVYYKSDIMNDTITDFIIDRARAKNNSDDIELAMLVGNAMPTIRVRLLVEFTKQIKECIRDWIKENGGNDKWALDSSISDTSSSMKDGALVVLRRNEKGWVLGEDWPVAGAGLTTGDHYCENVVLSVAARNEYTDDALAEFRVELEKRTRDKPALQGYKCKEISKTYKAMPAVWYLNDTKLGNWNSTEFRKEYFKQGGGKQMAQELADKLCALAAILDGMSKFKPLIFGETK